VDGCQPDDAHHSLELSVLYMCQPQSKLNPTLAQATIKE